MLLGVVAGVWVADHHGTTAWLLGAVCGGIASLVFRKKAVTFIVLGTLLGHGIHGLQIDLQRSWVNAARSGALANRVQLTGTIIDTGSSQDGPYLVQVHRMDGESDTPPPLQVKGARVILTPAIKNKRPLKYGDMIQCSGILREVGPMRNPYGFDRAQWFHRQGADLTITPSSAVVVQGVSWFRRPVRTTADWRVHLRQKMTSGLAPDSREAQLIRAVVLGERPPQPSGMIDDFRNSGTLHVFAVSGLHVGMVGTIIGSLLWLLRVPRWVLITGIILSMTLYAGITGLRPPAVRAVIMASVFLAGFLIRRRPSLINSLAASAVVVLLWDGHQLFTPGFQLSYGVLLTLALASAFWMRVLRPMAEIDPFMPRLLLTPWQERILNWRKWLRNSLSVSLAAWMGSAPLMWVHFGIITPIAIIAGIPLMLLVFVILALAMLSIAAGSVWAPAGETVNQVNALMAKATYSIAGTFADTPGGHWHRQPSRPEKGRVIVFDIPYGGGANLIDIGGGILLDCGRSDHFYRHVLPTLSALRSNPDSLIVSHADSKHSGGMPHCLDLFHPKQALIPRTDQLSKSYRHFLTRAEASGCRLVIPHSGQFLPIKPDVDLEILHAPVELEGKGRADDTGLVIRLHWYGWKILFTGDAGFITETRLLESGQDLSADVIITGRNRDDFTGREDFYRAVGPKAVISSNCDFPAEEIIPQSWFEMTRKLRITPLDQQQTGAVTLTIDHGKLVLTPTLTPDEPVIITR
ncbi:MAG: ComEC/Rec2 family competence protein [Akkermansiaceae bacterium]|nr:ComEC/Rec2 family competence protein [Akkermansiaceae bacterium]